MVYWWSGTHQAWVQLPVPHPVEPLVLPASGWSFVTIPWDWGGVSHSPHQASERSEAGVTITVVPSGDEGFGPFFCFLHQSLATASPERDLVSKQWQPRLCRLYWISGGQVLYYLSGYPGSTTEERQGEKGILGPNTPERCNPPWCLLGMCKQKVLTSGHFGGFLQ